MKRLPIYLVIAALFSAGCTFNTGYNPSYLPQRSFGLGIKGKSLVVMSESDASWMFTGSPSSLTGRATTLSIPLGEITRQVALKVYGAAFSDGADFKNTAGDSSSYRLVVRPKVYQLTYAYNQLKNIGFAITPQVNLTLEVILTTPDGREILRKSYASGLVDGNTYAISGQPAEKVNQILHVTLFKLMTDSACDAQLLLSK